MPKKLYKLKQHPLQNQHPIYLNEKIRVKNFLLRYATRKISIKIS